MKNEMNFLVLIGFLLRELWEFYYGSLFQSKLGNVLLQFTVKQRQNLVQGMTTSIVFMLTC